eukprot:231126-Pleurochrysis_carterae.AAC.1
MSKQTGILKAWAVQVAKGTMAHKENEKAKRSRSQQAPRTLERVDKVGLHSNLRPRPECKCPNQSFMVLLRSCDPV